MTMATSSREAILQNLRSSIPVEKVEHPTMPLFERKTDFLREEFELRLREAGGASQAVSSPEEALARLKELHSDAKVICSAVPEFAGTRNIRDVTDPHELADVDVGIVRAQFGIAESGAIWLTQEDLVLNALGFLSQHLIALLDPSQIVTDMHEAYRRVRLDKTAYGCFMMGPSATADVEATLVHGAQGARSLNVFFLPPVDSPTPA
jgi:L-lactate dehydrogenase complex protein LldG